MKKALLGLALFAAAFSIFAEEAIIVSVKGKVEVERDSEWIALNPGDTVDESEMISTGFQSEAIIKYNDSVLQMAPLTRVTLSKLASNSRRDVVDVYLNTGAVRAKVNHSDIKKVNYSVRNPIAVASVRGTEFIFQDNGSTICLEGAVAVAPARFYKNRPAEAETIEEIAEPEDGESEATTEATDVDPYSPKGSTLVAQGQATSISNTGFANTTFATAIAQVTATASSVTTAAASETVVASTTVSAAAAASPTTTTNPSAPNKKAASVSSNIKLDSEDPIVPGGVPGGVPGEVPGEVSDSVTVSSDITISEGDVVTPDPFDIVLPPETGDIVIDIVLPATLDVDIVFED